MAVCLSDTNSSPSSRGKESHAERAGAGWLSHEDGRPRAWKRELLTRAEPPCHPDHPPEGTPRPPALSPWPSPFPSAPPPLRHFAPHGTPRHQGLAPCWRLPWRDPGPASPLRAPDNCQSGAAKLHNEELSAACRLSGSRPDNFRYAKCRPLVESPPPASRPPPPGAPQKSALVARRSRPGLMEFSYKALTWNARKQKANPEGLAKCLNLLVVMSGLEPPTPGL